MKKVLILIAALAVISVALSSCRSSRPACPAYISTVTSSVFHF